MEPLSCDYNFDNNQNQSKYDCLLRLTIRINAKNNYGKALRAAQNIIILFDRLF